MKAVKTYEFTAWLIICLLLWGFYLLHENAHAGQKELMDKWVTSKREITSKIVERLRKEGKLPQNGIVEFSARVKPTESGELEIALDKLVVHPRKADSVSTGSLPQITDPSDEIASQFEEIFRPRNPSPFWTTGTIEIRSGKVTSEIMSIKPTEPSLSPDQAISQSKKTENRKEQDDKDSLRDKKPEGEKRFWHKLFGK